MNLILFPFYSTRFNQTLLDISAPRQHLEELKFGHYIKIPTYVADFTGFAPYAKDLKTNVFKFHKKFSGVAGKLYKMMIQRATKKFQGNEVQNFTTVSIHIRLTDFGQHLKGMFHVTYAPPEYFSRAMQYFTDRYQVYYNIRISCVYLILVFITFGAHLN